MQNKLIDLADKLLLRKHGIVESVGDILKEHMQMEYTRHRKCMELFPSYLYYFYCLSNK